MRPATIHHCFLVLSVLASVVLLNACASRPVNPPITRVDLTSGYRYETRLQRAGRSKNLVILAFSGGGTRAAAFSYGALELLRSTVVLGPDGEKKVRLLDSVDIITGVSGGSFTALAYGLYGDKLFEHYEGEFLKRDVQGELIRRLLNPVHWGDLSSGGWGRSELAAQYYDEVLFKGATYGDLERRPGPLIITTATDISTGSRLPFTQNTFDILCSDLGAVPLSRAASASAAVPVIFSPVTLSNYGGTCNYAIPHWLAPFVDPRATPRPAARAHRHLQEMLSYEDRARRPYIHLVDGGVADNVGMRGVLEALETLEALRAAGTPTLLDHVQRIAVFIVNAASSPKTHWDESERPPGALDILWKATGVPIDHHSYEAVELLNDIAARWRVMRRLQVSNPSAGAADPMVAEALNVPDVEIYAINVSFAAVKNQVEREYLNELPTSLALPGEAVDRLRAAARTIILESPEFHRLLRDAGGTIINQPSSSGSPEAKDNQGG